MSSSATEEPGGSAREEERDAIGRGVVRLPARSARRPVVLSRTGLVCWTTPWQRAGRDLLTVTCKATCDLRPDAAAVIRAEGDPPTGDLPWSDEPTGRLRYPSDLAPFKPQADVVVTSKALPAALSASGRRLRFRFGHPNAGFEQHDETPSVLLGALAPTSVERARGLGTYDARWLAERWPYLPDDFDYGHYQAAPLGQRLGYLRGDEPFEVAGLGADRAVLRGALPGIRPCCLHCRLERGALVLGRVALELDTVILDVDATTLHLLWRGVLGVSAPDAPEVGAICLLTEPIDAPLSDEQARAALLVELSLSRVSDVVPGAIWSGENDGRLRLPELERGQADEHRAVVLRRLASREPLTGLDLTGADLSDLDLRGQSLVGARLLRANLRGAQLEAADLSGAQLGGADLSNARLAGAKLVAADLTGATIEHASFDGAALDRASFIGAAGRGAGFARALGDGVRFAGADLTGAVFTDAAMAGADFSGAKIAEISGERARLPRARLYDARGPSARFAGADLTGARADGAELEQCSFRNATAPSSIWDDAKLDGGDFFGADLEAASLCAASCRGALFSQADLRRAVLREAKLSGASMLRADMAGCSLEAAQLAGADLRGANLYRAETWKADLTDTNLELANLFGTKLARGGP